MRISLLFILLITFQFELFGQKELIIQENMGVFPDVESYIVLYKDTSKNKIISEIASPSFEYNFKNYDHVNGTRKPNSIYWGKVIIKNGGSAFVNFFFALNNNNYVTLYQKEEAGNFSKKYAGELVKASQKDIKGSRKECLFKISLLPNQVKTLYFKIENVTGFKPNLSPELIHPKTWRAQNKVFFIKQSFFHGFLWIVLILSFLVFLGNKDKTYLYYGLYVSCISLYFLWNAGFFANYILPELPLINLFMWSIFPLSPFFYFLFFREFLETRVYAKKCDQIIKWMASLSASSFLIGVVLQKIFLHTFYLIIISNVILLFQLVFGVTLFIIIPKSAKLFKFALFGNLSLALTTIISIIMYSLGDANFASYGQIGSLIELIVFAMGLGYKVKLNEEKKRQAQDQLINLLESNRKLQDNVNKQLEAQVALRTQEITEKNEELEVQNLKIATQRDDILNKSERLEQVNAEIQMMNQQLEELVALRTKELTRAKNELDLFLYRTSHDLKGPLARIEGLIQVIKLEQGVHTNSNIESFEEVTKDMGKTLEKLLAISVINKSPEENHTITIESIIDFITINFRENAQVITYEFPDYFSFSSKPELIQLIIKALIENSLTFQYQNPTISVSFQSVNPEELKIKVSDNGDGIDEKNLPKIFDMFFIGSIKSEGNGLGLFIVDKAVKELGGEVTVKSELGRGTTFTITIPASIQISEKLLLTK